MSKPSSLHKILLLILCCSPLAQGHTADPPLLHYDFEKVEEDILFDLSESGIKGQIEGAGIVGAGSGSALSFDGQEDLVNCGNPEPLQLTGPLSLEVWVYPESIPRGEPGIAGKHFSRFLLTYYSNGKVYWYIGDGGNNCQAVLTPGGWNHVVGTFDGESMSLYIGGQLADRRKSKHPSIDPTGSFFIGAVPINPNAEDLLRDGFRYFHGKVDEMRVYDRALSATEVLAHFESEGPSIVSPTYLPVESGVSISNETCSLTIGGEGRLGIRTRRGEYALMSRWSYPGERRGWNSFAPDNTQSQSSWNPVSKRTSEGTLTVKAACESYRVDRTIRLKNDRILFEDRVINTSKAPVGILIDQELSGSVPFTEAIAPGGAECPVVFVKSESEALGLLVKDSVGRRKFEPRVGKPAVSARYRVSQFALGAGETHTFRWSIYLLPKESGFLDLANRIREDWDSSFTLEGPIEWFDIGRRADLLNDPEALKNYFERKKQGLVLLMPWLDYDPGSFAQIWSREEYKTRMREAAAKIRQANPGGKVLGCIETDWVTIDPTRIDGGDQLPFRGAGNIRLSTEETAILDKSDLPFLDSVRRDEEGRIIVEAYRRGGQQQSALGVYPAVGNYQFDFLMDQIVFLLDEVGLDGYYIDEFSQAFRNDLRDYSGWDGYSADLDPNTGEIRQQYIDCSLAGIEARVRLINAALDRGKVVVANTYATSGPEQSLPIFRFSETQSSFNPFSFEIGSKPPLVHELFRGSLASPIGLGIVQRPNHPNRAETLGRAVMTYLRHGGVYAHYALGDVPPEEGGYGILNHMYPLSPVEIQEGFIRGQERILTCLSGEYPWPSDERPTVRVFDLHGREVKPEIIECDREEKKVKLGGEDWTFFAVIE